MNTKTALIAVAVVAAILIVAAAAMILVRDNGGSEAPGTSGEYVTDALGRKVAVPESLDNGIVTIGSTGPLRFVSMFDVFDSIVEIDKGDITDNRNGRGYSYAYPYNTLDPNTRSHPDNALESATLESIVNRHPDLVVTNESVWNNYSKNFGILAGQCTVVVLKDQQMKYMTDAEGGLADYFEFNVDLLGKVLGKEDRAAEIVSEIEDILRDIRDISGTSSEMIYVAGVTINGSNTLNTTFPTYVPFSLTGTNNAYTWGSNDNRVVLNIETFAGMDIDMIVVDPSSSDKIGEKDSQLVLEYLYGLNNDSDPDNDVPIYITVPIVWDSINYDCTLASAYYVAHLAYGSVTLEEVEQRIVHVFEVFYGEHGSNVFADMGSFFEGKSSDNGQEMPLLGEVSIVYDPASGTYRLVGA